MRKLVEEEGVWPNIPDPDSHRVQALHAAAGAGHLPVVSFLVLECGINSTSATALALPRLPA